MTLADLLARHRAAQGDRLLTLRQIHRATGTPMRTLRDWTQEPACLAHEHIGPARIIKVRLSVVMAFYPPGAVDLSALG